MNHLSQTMPVDPATGKPLTPRAQPGYYPGYSTLAQQAFWDEATRQVVLDRVNNVPPIRFFADCLPLARAIFDRIIPQDDRDENHRIPVVNYVDDRLSSGRTDGYRYAGMPPDGEAYHLALAGIDALARDRHQRAFAEIEPRNQEAILLTLRDGNPSTPQDTWTQVPPPHFWQMLLTDAADAYYAHPYAWDEIGFGGPAYPRGYMRLEKGHPEPWEKREQRYAWDPPPDSLSGAYHPVEGIYAVRATPGQEGSH